MSSNASPDSGRAFLYSGIAGGLGPPAQHSPHSPQDRPSTSAARLSSPGSAAALSAPSDTAVLHRPSSGAVSTSTKRGPHEAARTGREASATTCDTESSQWGPSLVNIEEAQVDMDRLAHAIEEAIYLVRNLPIHLGLHIIETLPESITTPDSSTGETAHRASPSSNLLKVKLGRRTKTLTISWLPSQRSCAPSR